MNKFNFDEEECKRKVAEEVMKKILGGSGQGFGFGNMLGGLSIRLGGLLGGVPQQSMRITNIPARVSTGNQPSRRNRLRPKKKRISNFKSKTPLLRREKEDIRPNFEDLKNWVVEELALLFEMKQHNKEIDIEDRKAWLLDSIPEVLIKEVTEKAQELSKKSREVEDG